MKTIKRLFEISGFLVLVTGVIQCGADTDETRLMDTGEQFLLEVISDNGLGEVSSDTGGIFCGTACTVAVDAGTTVTLTATPLPDLGATFLGWEGPCSGNQPTCTVTMNQAARVTASWQRKDAVYPPPVVTSVSPAKAPNDVPTLITITGSGFQNAAAVTVGGKPCTNAVLLSSNQITCTAPASAATCGAQAVAVTNPDAQTDSKTAFSYQSASVAFASPTTLTGTQNGAHRMVVADFNGDGKLDLAHSNSNSNTVSVYLGGAAGAFGTATNMAVGSQPIGIAVGDLNKDNKLDLLVANVGGGSISFLAGDGLGGFAAAADITGFMGPEGLGIGDIDGDTNPDVVVGNGGTSSVLVLKGNGTGGLTMGTPVTVGSNPKYLALVDVNKDGQLDLLVPNQGSNSVSYRPGNGNGTFGAGMDIAVGIDPYEVIVADVNSDQSQDFLFTSSNTNQVGVLLGNGTGAFSAAAGSPFAVGSFPVFMSVADLNGDGRLDFITANQGSSNLSVLLGNGAGSFAAVQGSPFAAGNGATGIATGDFNGDGYIDVANSNYGASSAITQLGICN
jgi:hypothetical protein